LEYDAELGLSVLTTRPKGKVGSFGGKGVTVQEVLNFLESVSPKSSSGSPLALSRAMYASLMSKQRAINASNSANASGNVPRNDSFRGDDPMSLSSSSAGISNLKIPLVNGKALGVTYLEWLVNSGAAPASMHNEYAQLLMEGVPTDIIVDHSSSDFDIKEGDSDELTLYKIYRLKLQHFLETSTEYHPDRLLRYLSSQFSHEYALILSKLGKHEDVLRIYINQLSDLSLAEAYCERIHRRMSEEKHSSSKRTNARSSYNPDDESVHLCLIKVLLAAPRVVVAGKFQPPALVFAGADRVAGQSQNLHLIVGIAEKYYDRIDAATFLAMLPTQIPLTCLAKYLNTVIEYGNTKKRNLQIVHQLLRVREVNIRTSQYAHTDEDLK